MSNTPLHVVTGAFGFSGQYMARRLLASGIRVRTLTNSPSRPHEFGNRVEVRPLQFNDEDALARSLEGTDVLYNTYWVRFDHALFNHGTAVANTLALLRAAQRAGVGRIVHVSITNPSADSPLPYFSGKARLENALIDSGIPHSILRPAVLFGPEDILINNIAWGLRTLPVFGVFGKGDYRLRPIHVDDFAALAVEHGSITGNHLVDAVGPESFTYKELVQTIGGIIRCQPPVISVPPSLGYWVGRVVGLWQRDVFITREEVTGLMAGLLDTNTQPTGPTRLTEWAQANANRLGRQYASEMARRRDRTAAYLKAG